MGKNYLKGWQEASVMYGLYRGNPVTVGLGRNEMNDVLRWQTCSCHLTPKPIPVCRHPHDQITIFQWCPAWAKLWALMLRSHTWWAVSCFMLFSFLWTQWFVYEARGRGTPECSLYPITCNIDSLVLFLYLNNSYSHWLRIWPSFFNL